MDDVRGNGWGGRTDGGDRGDLGGRSVGGQVLDGLGETIAALPAMLGFVPADSMVAVFLRHGEAGDGDSVGPVARMDLPSGDLADPDIRAGLVADLAECIGRVRAAVAGIRAVILVIIGGKATPTCTVELVEEAAVAARFAGVEPVAAAMIRELVAGGRWRDLLGKDAGVLGDPRSSEMALRRVMDGECIHRSRRELERLLDPVPDLDEKDLGRRMGAIRWGASRGPARTAAGARVLLDLVDGLACGDEIGVEDVVEASCALSDPAVVDHMYGLAATSSREYADELWAIIARRGGVTARAEAAALYAFGRYCRGLGAQARVGIEAASAAVPGHGVARVLRECLDTATPPELLREVARGSLRGLVDADFFGSGIADGLRAA